MMANGRRIRRQQARKTAMIAAKVSGCTCRPNIVVGAGRGDADVRVEHDAWCPLYCWGIQYVSAPDDFGRCGR